MKACLIIGPAYVFHYNDVYPLLLDKTLKVGVWCIGWQLSKNKPGAIVSNWFTTLKVNRPDEKKLVLTKTYNPDDYPRFDNAHDIIESKSKDIPVDYQGDMGVTTMILLRYNGNYDYEIVDGPIRPKLNGKTKFPRLIIRRKQL